MSKYKFQQLDPQPARGVLREELWDSPEWVAEEKYDGDRRVAQFCGKVARFTGRRKSVKDGLYVEKTENVPHLSGYGPKMPGGRARTITAQTMVIPPVPLEGTVLDGEVIAWRPDPTNGGASKYVTSIMGSLPEEAIKKQVERGWLRYVVFDCLFYKGKDLRGELLDIRRAAALQALTAWGNPFVSLAEQTAVHEDKRAYYREIVNRGGEGVVLKRLDHKYGDRAGWVKVKRQATADVVIMGFKPAKEMSKKVNGEESMTKYAKLGLIGAIVCGQYRARRPDERHDFLEEVATVSGMTDELRAEFTARPKKYIGKVIEIETNGREPTGRFRHPRWSRFRPDKVARDCVYREGEV